MARRFSLLEVLCGISILSFSSVLVVGGYEYFVHRQVGYIEEHKLREKTERIFYDVLRKEYLDTVDVHWGRFTTHEEVKVNLCSMEMSIIPEMNRSYDVVLSFRKTFQLPVSNSRSPWKRCILARVYFYRKGTSKVAGSFDRLLVFEKMRRDLS